MLKITDFVTFSNGICVVNTTEDDINMQAPDGHVEIVPPCGISVSVKAVEHATDRAGFFVQTGFAGNKRGWKSIQNLSDFWYQNVRKEEEQLVIIGNTMAAQAYPRRVFCVIPMSECESVSPHEKIMRCDKFMTFEQSSLNDIYDTYSKY